MDDLNNLDDTTTLVVLENWLEDVNHEIASRKRKRDDEDDTDADLQLVLTKNEVNSRIAFIADRAAARITAGEDAADYHDNNQAKDDHRDAPNDDPPNGNPPLNDGPPNDDLPTAEANQVQLGTNDPPICICCHESFADDKLAQCPCEHKYCKECLQHLVENLACRHDFVPSPLLSTEHSRRRYKNTSLSRAPDRGTLYGQEARDGHPQPRILPHARLLFVHPPTGHKGRGRRLPPVSIQDVHPLQRCSA